MTHAVRGEERIAKRRLRFRDVVCPVCQTAARKVVLEDINRREGLAVCGRYVQCAECSMIYLTPVPDWMEFRESYEDLLAVEERIGGIPCLASDGRAGKILRQMVGWTRRFRRRPHSMPEGSGAGVRRILDIGCNTGEKLVEFSQREWEVWGIDINPRAIEIARSVVPRGRFLVGEIGDLSLPSETFDAIRMDSVLEHIPEPSRVLSACRSLLKPSGNLYLFVPNGTSLSMGVLGRYSINAWIPFHLNLFTSQSLSRLLTQCGFRDVRIMHYSPPDWLPLCLLQCISAPGFWRRRNRPFMLPLKLFLRPVGMLAAWAKRGEELIAVAAR